MLSHKGYAKVPFWELFSEKDQTETARGLSHETNWYFNILVLQHVNIMEFSGMDFQSNPRIFQSFRFKEDTNLPDLEKSAGINKLSWGPRVSGHPLQLRLRW